MAGLYLPACAGTRAQRLLCFNPQRDRQTDPVLSRRLYAADVCAMLTAICTHAPFNQAEARRLLDTDQILSWPMDKPLRPDVCSTGVCKCKKAHRSNHHGRRAGLPACLPTMPCRVRCCGQRALLLLSLPMLTRARLTMDVDTLHPTPYLF